MREGETVNESETVNQSQGAAAGGSGDSPEKLVADHVENLWEHIAADGYDLLADVAVESLTRNGDVPPDAYLRSVKMSWCLHRAALYYARQYSVERVSADFARGDAQFEHSLRAQAERKAEKLKADLAQSVLLVESQRLRLDELEELRRKLETAEAALLEQQQRNEALATTNSQQFMKITELQRQVEAMKTQEPKRWPAPDQWPAPDKTQELEGKTQELEGKTQELEGKTQELPEYTPPEGWRLLQTGETLTLGDIWVRPFDDAMFQTVHVGRTVGKNRRYIRRIEPEGQHGKYTPPEGWRVLAVGEVLQEGDVWVSWDGSVKRPDILHGDGATVSGGRYIRNIEPAPQPQPEPDAGAQGQDCGTAAAG
ncbi:hypothetical protein LBMAG46_42300 [Planctomycetia bacterium]|nr:hypothetical protein LBMAG46_42300 [Planctomycetia bacterium]